MLAALSFLRSVYVCPTPTMSTGCPVAYTIETAAPRRSALRTAQCTADEHKSRAACWN